MSKQILYPSLITRLFSTMIDLVILVIFSKPFMEWLTKNIYFFKFRDLLLANNIDIANMAAVQEAFTDPEFIQQINIEEVIICTFMLIMINIGIMAFYFIFFWCKYKATPGKIIMSMHVVTQETYDKLSIWQAIKRFLAYSTALIGIWLVPFHKKGLAFHDKLAGTIVIKK